MLGPTASIKGSLDPPVFQSLGQHESHQTWPEEIFRMELHSGKPTELAGTWGDPE